jgi:hypothetical protein
LTIMPFQFHLPARDISDAMIWRLAMLKRA